MNFIVRVLDRLGFCGWLFGVVQRLADRLCGIGFHVWVIMNPGPEAFHDVRCANCEVKRPHRASGVWTSVRRKMDQD